MGKSFVIGLDIGRYAIKIVLIRVTPHRRTFISHLQIEQTTNIFSDNFVVNYPAILEKLQVVKQKLSWRYRYLPLQVAISLPDHAVIQHVVSVKRYLQGRELQFAIQTALARQTAVATQALAIDFYPSSDASKADASVASEQDTGVLEANTDYTVYATHYKVLESRVYAIQKLGYRPLLCEPESHTFCHLLGLAARRGSGNVDGCFLLHLGFSHTIFCAAPVGSPPIYRVIPFGSQLLAQEGDERVSCFCQQLASKIQTQLRICRAINLEHPLEGCWLSGGVTHLTGLCESMSRYLAMPCEVLDLPHRLCETQLLAGIDSTSLDLRGYEHALGLALNGANWYEAHHGYSN